MTSSRPDLTQGQYALLTVSDSGRGMDAEVLEHILEPFFTTKGPDKGTGLGLATVYGIVTQHGGHITADSRTGAGSTFCIYLPVISAVNDASSLEETDTMPRGGGEAILLVEDESQVRAVERRTLQRLGYDVIEASNGEEALRLVSGLERLPDLVVTDMVMPRMGGVQLAAKLRATHPGLRYLFTSGYTDDPGALASASGGGHYLHRPFSAQGLATTVRRALEAPLGPPADDRPADAP